MIVLHPYRLFIDPRAAATRAKLRSLAIRDAFSGRWALHLSTEEHDMLEKLNPDTLGHPDSAISKEEWKRFIGSQESYEYRVQNKI